MGKLRPRRLSDPPAVAWLMSREAQTSLQAAWPSALHQFNPGHILFFPLVVSILRAQPWPFVSEAQHLVQRLPHWKSQTAIEFID